MAVAAGIAVGAGTLVACGMAVGSLIEGWVAEHVGYVAMYRVAAGLSSIGLILFVVLFRGGLHTETELDKA